ncbi:MAG: GNAT family N-acetyltransferase [Pseudomonadota bacterium]
MTLSVPQLETKRLRLRGWYQADAVPLTKIFEHESARFIGGQGNYAKAWRVMAMHIGQWAIHGYGTWAVEDRNSGELIGFCGLWHPGDWPELELGWSLMPDRRGHGFATEAAIAGRAWTYDQLKASTLVSYIDPANTPSIRVAERLGCVRDGNVELSGSVSIVFRHPSPEAISS